MSTSSGTVGIDAGATLCKLVLFSDGLQTALFPSNELEAVRSRVESWGARQIVATGGGCRALGSRIGGVSVRRVGEFDAWARGAPLLAQREGIELPRSYLLVSLGTGTSALLVRDDQAQRAGGSALGGGTLLGLGRLLMEVSSFQELADLAARGDRRGVDLLVGDIYAGEEGPLPAELTAASFGKLASTRREDLAHALVGLVGENIGLICGGLTRVTEAEAIVYGGSTVVGNPALEQILRVMAQAFGPACHILAAGPFCGAVGAAALADS
jgi:type II pantothenate kinase